MAAGGNSRCSQVPPPRANRPPHTHTLPPAAMMSHGVKRALYVAFAVSYLVLALGYVVFAIETPH
jgi:hypothetical protein